MRLPRNLVRWLRRHKEVNPVNSFEHPVLLPKKLEDLKGPLTPFSLPADLYWGPANFFHPDRVSEITCAYRAVITEAHRRHHLDWINGALLAAVWKDLDLTDRYASAWENAFPVLAVARNMSDPVIDYGTPKLFVPGKLAF